MKTAAALIILSACSQEPPAPRAVEQSAQVADSCRPPACYPDPLPPHPSIGNK